MRRLSAEAKQAIVKQALASNGQSMHEIASINNIGYSTLTKWVKRYTSANPISDNQKSTDTPITLTERFKHLQVTVGQDDVTVGAYCRKHGLYRHQLAQWEAQFMTNKISPKAQQNAAELKALRVEVKTLKKLLLQKDKVLAETVALLVLKKKAAQIWGENEDD
jgi:transposase-like protein